MDNHSWIVKAIINKAVIEGAVVEKEIEARWPIEAVEKFKKKQTVDVICNMVSIEVKKA